MTKQFGFCNNLFLENQNVVLKIMKGKSGMRMTKICLQLLGLQSSPCSKAQREMLNDPMEQDSVPNWFQITESLLSISTA